MAETPENADDEFRNLKARIADQQMANATPGDRAIFDAVSAVEHKCVLLQRSDHKHTEEIAELKAELAPMTALYQKLSSGYAIIIYVAGGLFALIKVIGELKVMLK